MYAYRCAGNKEVSRRMCWIKQFVGCLLCRVCSKDMHVLSPSTQVLVLVCVSYMLFNYIPPGGTGVSFSTTGGSIMSCWSCSLVTRGPGNAAHECCAGTARTRARCNLHTNIPWALALSAARGWVVLLGGRQDNRRRTVLLLLWHTNLCAVADESS